MKLLLIFLVLLFPILAVGHDVYYYYEHQEEGFKFSQIGWVWKNYHAESHTSALEIIGVPPWKQYITPILSMPSIIFGLAISGIILILVFLAISLQMLSKVGHRGKKSGRGGKQMSRDSSLGRGRERGQKFEYKRR